MRTITRALDYRKSLPQTAREPFRAFLSRLDHPISVLHMVEASRVPSAIAFEARRQFIICLCAAFELFWRTFFRTAVNTRSAAEIDLTKVRNRTFRFDEVSTILHTRLTLGELLTFSFGFQGPNAVSDFAKDVFRLDLAGILGNAKLTATIEAVERADQQTEGRCVVVAGDAILRERPLIERCFAIRNEAAHASGARYRPSAQSVESYYDAMCRFNMYASVALDMALSGEKAGMKQHTVCAQDLDAIARLLGPHPRRR